jgi:hypothetical protein
MEFISDKLMKRVGSMAKDSLFTILAKSTKDKFAKI